MNPVALRRTPTQFKQFVATLPLVALLAFTSVHAATQYTWTGATSSDWTVGTNWSGGSAPATGSYSARLNINTANPLVYAAGDTTFANADSGGRGFVINNGSFSITGGNFSTVGSKGADVMGNAGNANNALIIDGGTYTSSSFGLIMNFGFSSGQTSALTVNSGSATITRLEVNTPTTGSGTVNLNGGTLTVTTFAPPTNTVGTSVFNMNGGTLRVGASSATYLQTFNSAFVKAGGAVIDTAGFDAGVGQALLTDTVSTGGGLTKQGEGTLTLSGDNTYTGATTVEEGTLALGAAERIADSSTLVMAGGTFATGGFNETLGTLDLTASSIIDLGDGTSALVFADSSGEAWAGGSISLNFVNFTDGLDSIRIGTSASGLTEFQLAQITINGFAAAIDAGGFLSVANIPEPSTYAVLAGVGAMALASAQRRRR